MWDGAQRCGDHAPFTHIYTLTLPITRSITVPPIITFSKRNNNLSIPIPIHKHGPTTRRPFATCILLPREVLVDERVEVGSSAVTRRVAVWREMSWAGVAVWGRLVLFIYAGVGLVRGEILVVMAGRGSGPAWWSW